jgi:exodeoxyribonuclease VII small subunit
MASTKKAENFEDTLEKLEGVVSSLEKGELPLGKSIEMFEEGIKMYNECKDFLVDAEKKIKVLTESLEEEEYEEK